MKTKRRKRKGAGESRLRANLDEITYAIQRSEHVDARELVNEQCIVSLHTHEMSGTTMIVTVVGLGTW